MTNNKKATGVGKPQAASKSFTQSHFNSNRFVLLTNRILEVLKRSNIQDDEEITIRITVTDIDGGLLKSGKFLEFNDLHRGDYE